jgi:alpha-amylase
MDLPMPAAATYADSSPARRPRGAATCTALHPRRHLAQLPVPLPGSQLDAQAHAGLSARLAALPAAPPALVDDLYRAQANDAYWHGLFGGLYLPHLRRAVWNNIVELEAELDRLQPRAPGGRRCRPRWPPKPWHAAPGCRSPCATTGSAPSTNCPAILNHNFGDTLRRYHEHYHERISR